MKSPSEIDKSQSRIADAKSNAQFQTAQLSLGPTNCESIDSRSCSRRAATAGRLERQPKEHGENDSQCREAAIACASSSGPFGGRALQFVAAAASRLHRFVPNESAGSRPQLTTATAPRLKSENTIRSFELARVNLLHQLSGATLISVPASRKRKACDQTRKLEDRLRPD